MKILIAADTYPPDINGAAQFARRLAHGLLEHGHEVHVMVPATGKGKSSTVVEAGVVEHRIRSHHAFTHPYFRFCFPWEVTGDVRRVMDEVQPDAVHSQGHYVLGRLAIHEAQRRGVRVVATNHLVPENIEPFLPFPRWFILGYRKVSWWDMARQYRRCDVVTTPTQLAVDNMVSNGVDDTVIPVSNGIRVGDYERHGGEQIERPDYRTVLFCGRLAVEKNVNELIEAVSLIPPEKNVHAEIVGEGEQLDSLVSLSHELGVADRIHFRGFISDDQLRLAYLRADVFCQPGTAELQSLVTLEAMSASRPVVLANARALPHLAQEGVNGYLFEPGNAKDLAHKLQLVLDAPPEVRCAMGEASHRMMREHEFARTLETFERIYRGEPVT